MTFISRVPLNIYRTESRKLLGSRQVAHATVLQSFAPGQSLASENGRVLWRFDFSDDGAGLLILSPERPSLDHIVENCGWKEADSNSFQTVDYDGLLESVQEGAEYILRSTFNPTTSVTNSKRVAVEEAAVSDWLVSKVAEHGLEVTRTVIEDYSKESFKRGQGVVTLAISTAKFEAKVIKLDAFKNLLLNGFGRAKGYGCGLVTIESELNVGRGVSS